MDRRKSRRNWIFLELIQYARQNILQADIDAVINALKSEFLTQGPTVSSFEKAVAKRVSASYAVATNSATSSLHLACLALGLGPGDLLWTVPNSFVASANCALLCGSDVDFVDIESEYYCIDVSKLESKLNSAATAGKLPKALVVVHYSGRSANMEAIREVASKYDELKIIEDAAHATGASYKGIPVGSCQFSDVTVFSFHPVKIMTTGEGGVALTNNEELAARMARIRTHGVTRDPNEMVNNKPEPWEFEQVELGLNYRITEMQAALGISQLDRLNSFISRRRFLAERYNALLKNLPLILPPLQPTGESSWHLYPILIDCQNSHLSRLEVYYSLLEKGIKANVHFIPIHTHPYYQKMGFKKGDFPISEWFYENELSLPMYYDLSDDQQDRVVDTLHDIFA